MQAHTAHACCGHGYIIYTLDKAGIILRVMTPKQWEAYAAEAKSWGTQPVIPAVSEVQGQPLSAFMMPRLAAFYFTLCSLIRDGDICHSQFHWYCDDPRTRRQMVTFIYQEEDIIVICNVTVKESPHVVPVDFMKGNEKSQLWRCAFCGWCSCEGDAWMEPEDFHIWCVRERPALLKNADFYAVVCEECVSDWVARHDNPEIRTAIENLRPLSMGVSPSPSLEGLCLV